MARNIVVDAQHAGQDLSDQIKNHLSHLQLLNVVAELQLD